MTFLRDLWLNAIGGSFLLPKTLRFVVLRVAGLQLGTRHINRGCFFGGSNVKIGRRTFVSYRLFL